jgi:hypothetical protein
MNEETPNGGTATSIERIAAAVEQLIKSAPVPAAATPHEPEVPSQDGAAPAAASEAVPPAPAEGGAPGVDELVKAGREALRQRADLDLGAVAVDARATRLLLADAGHSIGVSDDGALVIGLKDGREVPLSYEGLREAGISDAMLRPRGKAGSGLQERGGVHAPVDHLQRGLEDQSYFEMNRGAVLRELARRKGVGS